MVNLKAGGWTLLGVSILAVGYVALKIAVPLVCAILLFLFLREVLKD